MSYANSHSFSIGGFAIACSLAIAISGSALLGFIHLAQSYDTATAQTTSQLAAAAVPLALVTL